MRMSETEYRHSLSLKSTIVGMAAGTAAGRRTRRKLLARARAIESRLSQGLEPDPDKAKALAKQAGELRLACLPGWYYEILYGPFPRQHDGQRPPEMRWLLLAYAWLRGKTWNRVEPTRRVPVSPARVAHYIAAWLCPKTTNWGPSMTVLSNAEYAEASIRAWLEAGDKNRWEIDVRKPERVVKPVTITRVPGSRIEDVA